MLKKRIAELEARGPETRIEYVDRVVEVPVGATVVTGVEERKEEKVETNYEETFDIVGTVEVGEEEKQMDLNTDAILK